MINAELLRHSDKVAWRLRRAGVSGRTVTIKLRFGDFTTITRSQTLDSATDVGRDVYRAAMRLAERIDIADRGVRLLGVGITGLTEEDEPRQLAVDREARWDELADAVHEVREKFGQDMVEPARLRETGKNSTTPTENLD